MELRRLSGTPQRGATARTNLTARQLTRSRHGSKVDDHFGCRGSRLARFCCTWPAEGGRRVAGRTTDRHVPAGNRSIAARARHGTADGASRPEAGRSRQGRGTERWMARRYGRLVAALSSSELRLLIGQWVSATGAGPRAANLPIDPAGRPGSGVHGLGMGQ